MQFKQIVILGGGFAGLLAARICADVAEQVTIIERYPDPESGFRRGIPQAHHLHVLMKAGQTILEQLFPGILQTLQNHGATQVDWAQDTHWQGPFGTYPQYDSTMQTWLCSRALLDQLLYQYIKALPKVEIVAATVKKLDFNQQHKVTAVSAEDVASKTSYHFVPDLVIEARGRSTNLNKLLAEILTEPIKCQTVTNKVSYYSNWFEQPAANTLPFKQCYIQMRPDKQAMGVVISPIENNKLVTTFIGWNKTWQHDANELLAEIAQPQPQAILANAVPIMGYKQFRNLHNVRYRLSKVKHWPANLMVMGDAVCRLNPVYGQGMTLCAKQALLLQQTLATWQPNSTKQAQRFQRRVERLLMVPWLLATVEDQRDRTKSELTWPIKIMHKCLDRLFHVAAQNPNVHQRFLTVLHMQQSPLCLLNPKALRPLLGLSRHKQVNH